MCSSCALLNPWTAREPGFERYFTSSTQETKSYARSPGTGAGLTGDFNWETGVKFWELLKHLEVSMRLHLGH